MDANKINLALDSMLGNEISDWEREELAEKLVDVPKEILREIMSSLPVIWPVSYALFLAFVDQAVKAGSCLKPSQYKEWVKAILDVYEAEGLRQAQLFMEEVEDKYLCQIRGQRGIRLEDCEARLLLYARSILGRDVKLTSGRQPFFDTETIGLPAEVTDFDTPDKGFLFYKFTVTFLLHLDILGTYRFPASTINELALKDDVPLEYGDFFKKFDNPALAQDLFLLAESARICAALHKEYPGLMSDMKDLLPIENGDHKRKGNDQNRFVADLKQWLLSSIQTHPESSSAKSATTDCLADHYDHAQSVWDSLKCTQTLYKQCACLHGSYAAELCLPFIGRLCFAEAQIQIDLRREELKNSFMQALGTQIYDELKNTEPEEHQSPAGQSPEQGAGTLLAMVAEHGDIEEEDLNADQEVFRIGTMEFDLSEELSARAREVFKEFGKIPGDFIAGAVGRAGDLFDESDDGGQGDDASKPVTGEAVYDEWDYRRAGYRKNWCKVIMKDIQPAYGTFVENTLRKHKGLLVNLRRQFEMMSVQEKFEKRQREGDEIDLDALIDSVSDTRAGLPPSERLFIRLQRNDRQIAALFLVDMSSSTEGWVSTALKEALILMSESLAVLGDRYAIYGFSGMRRTRSELFTVKKFDEPYGEAVKNKIAGISPKEYTRMAPAIRHASHILENTEGKIRLLITLSDGKPEDYDGYKGVYAMEDTRHALIEAKSVGIHPFCITVDKEAHSYMAHMYGEVNYIFIDKLAQLPLRMPEIYRNLTT